MKKAIKEAAESVSGILSLSVSKIYEARNGLWFH
jgi:hypothetical protein